MAQGWRTVRVFISSTFRDMHAERDHLVQRVFPELEERCRRRSIRLVPIDLRWGVSEEEAEQGKVLEICLDEIDRARPFFVGLLGERYGYVPTEYRTEDQARFGWLKKEEKGHSITALEIIHGVLHSEEQHRRSFFYFRDPTFSAQLRPEFRADFAAEDETTKGRLQGLKAEIRKAYHSQMDHLREYSPYFGGIKIDHILVQQTSTSPNELQSLRRLAPDGLVSPQDLNDLGEPDRQLLRRHGSVMLKGLETPDETTEDPPVLKRSMTFSKLILEDLWEAIDAEFPAIEEVRDELTVERDRHLSFIVERTRVVAAQVHGQGHIPARIFVGREADLKCLTDYVAQEAESVRPLVVLGRYGSGKTSLVAELAAQLEKQSPGLFLVPVFAGLTPASRTVVGVLERITAELALHYGFEIERTVVDESEPFRLDTKLQKTAEERVQAFQGALEKATRLATEKGRALILIDAADQMLETGEGGVLSWLPALLHPEVKILVSAAEGTKPAEAARVRQLPVHTLEPLSPQEAAKAIRHHLKEYGKELGFDKTRGLDQMQLLLAKPDIALPLYLAAACEELRVHPSFDTLTHKIQAFPDDVEGLLEAVLARIESDHGREFVANALALIACSGEGLTESEILGLLAEAQGKKVPMAHWAPLRRSLSAYLRGEGEDSCYFFFHHLLEEAVWKRYLADPEAERRIYALLAQTGLRELKRSLALPMKILALQFPSTLQTRVGYSLFKAGMDNELVETLHRLLQVDEDAWPWYRRVFDVLVDQVQRQKTDYASLETHLDALAARLAKGEEEPWERMELWILQTSDALQQKGASDLAEHCLRVSIDLISLRSDPDRPSSRLQHSLSISLNNLGNLARDAGRVDEALRYFQESLDITRSLVAAEPQRTGFQHGLSVSLGNLGNLAMAAGRIEEAFRYFNEDLDLSRPLVAADPQNLSLISDLVLSLNNLGNLAQDAGRGDEATRYFQEMLDISRPLVADGSFSLTQDDALNDEAIRGLKKILSDLTSNLVLSLNNLGNLAQDAGQGDEATRYFQEMLDITRALVAAEPQHTDWKRKLSVSLNHLGKLAMVAGRNDEALRYYQESLEITRALVAAEPQRMDWKRDLLFSLNQLGILASAAGHSKEALRYFQESLDIMRTRVAAEPQDTDLQHGLSAILGNLGKLAMAAGRVDEAFRYFQETLEIMHAIVAAEPRRADLKHDLSAFLKNLGDLARTAGRGDEAFSFFKEDLNIIRAFVATEPRRVDLKRELSVSLSDLGNLARAAGRNDEALRYYQESLEIMRAIVAAEPLRADLKRDLSALLKNLGDLAGTAGRNDEALSYFKEELNIHRALVATDPQCPDWALGLSISCWHMFTISPPEEEMRWLTEGRDINLRLRSLGFNDARIDQGLQLFEQELAKRKSGQRGIPSHQVRDSYLTQLNQAFNAFKTCPPEDALRWLGEAREALQALRRDGDWYQELEEIERFVLRQIASREPGNQGRPQGDENQGSDKRYKNQLAEWKALPLWKRLITKRPESPNSR
jgi:tetratricopeptide (TPR) repeat protein